METKKQIRTRALEKRRALPSKARNVYSHTICRLVMEHPLFQSAREIYCYASFRGEAETVRLMEEAVITYRERKFYGMLNGLPKDPVILLSVVNTRLRDCYPTLDALCEDLEVSRKDLEEKLGQTGYEYMKEKNQFV